TPSLWDLVAPSVREVLTASGWLGRPFWLTETGWASDTLGEQGQSDQYAAFLNDWCSGQPSRAWLSRVLFYELIDDATARLPRHGIRRADGSAKPAYDTYRAFIAAHPAPPGRIVPIVLDAFGRGTARFTSELVLANRTQADSALTLT